MKTSSAQCVFAVLERECGRNIDLGFMQLEHEALIAPCWAKVKLVLCRSSDIIDDAFGQSTRFTQSSSADMDCTDVFIEDILHCLILSRVRVDRLPSVCYRRALPLLFAVLSAQNCS